MITRRRMLRILLTRSLRLRVGRTFIALLALVIAATLLTTMLALYAQLQSRLEHEFRSYGANIVVTSAQRSFLPADATTRTQQLLGDRALVLPSAMLIATSDVGQPVAIVGMDLRSARRVNSWWSVTNWPDAADRGAALVGTRALPLFKDGALTVTYAGRKLTIHPVGTLETGGPEETRIYLPLEQVQQWAATPQQPVTANILEISYTGSEEQVESAVAALNAAFGGAAEVHPVRKIVEAEASVIRKTRRLMFASAALIIITVVLCVLSTLTTSVLERRRDFALMKALGASQRAVNAIFSSEAALLGVLAGAIGFPAGCAVSAAIGRADFHSAFVPSLIMLPVVLLLTAAIALLAAELSLAQLRRLQPASILKGE